jgi:hypothetical protein
MNKTITTSITLLIVFTSTLLAEFSFSKIPTKLTAYYSASIQPIDVLEEKLNLNGFRVLAITEILRGEIVLTISNNQLLQTNSYLSTLQLLVNTIHAEIRIQNPSYFGVAYLQEKYHYGQFKATLDALERVLGQLRPVKERYSFKKLAYFQFMFGLPYFKDMLSIPVLGNPLKILNKEDYLLYNLKLPNGNRLIGHKFRTRTNRFLHIIGQEQNAVLLPYESMIEDSKVTILDPKYYLALSLPLLSLGEFMKIATTPDTIKREITKAYK